MNKEQQIKDIKKCIGEGFSDLICGAEDFEVIYKCIQDGAEALYNAGYRNQKKAVEEFAEKLKERITADYVNGCLNNHKGHITEWDIDELLKEYEQ